MLKVTVEDNRSSGDDIVFNLRQEKENWLIDDRKFDGDLLQLSENQYHVIWENKSYNIEIIRADYTEKVFEILINGRMIHTKAKGEFDLLLESMGMQANAVQKINHVKAPMPGLIQSISVVEGDTVKKGDILLVLVAMKMENVIKSPGDGIVKILKVSAGEIVEKNQVMLEFQ
jgi:acetyl/propionyl-CoA carboxylase alpha subunit